MVTGQHKAHDPAKQVKSASVESRQDQLRVDHEVYVECEGHVQQGSSPRWWVGFRRVL